MLNWQVPVYKRLCLVAVRLLGVIDVTFEVPTLKDAPVDLVKVVERGEELCSLEVRMAIREHGCHASIREPTK